MNAAQTTQETINQKLAAFEQLQPKFEECFRFVEDVHGLKRFATVSVADCVRYLHSLWVCERKDRLLSIYKNIERYEGRLCLELLDLWQRGEAADVVAFLQRKLDMLPLADITRQIHEAHRFGGDDGLEQRLLHGRLIMLNRGMNLLHALDAVFALPDEQLAQEVRVACERYGHTPVQIARQIAEMDAPIYTYIPHQSLANRNMVVMNKLGVNVMSKPVDQPGSRSWRVLEPTEPMSPFAEHVILGYQELTLPLHNNIWQDRFMDRPEQSDAGTV